MTNSAVHGRGLSLAPFRASRFTASDRDLGARLSPPYDVVSPEDRARLLASSPDNIVRVILPEHSEAALGGGDPYTGASKLLDEWIATGVLAVDAEPALFVYEMRSATGQATRGLLGAVELRDPDDGVILPHEDTMAGPVSDRLALMTATQADLEPIYLVYDGGGAASELVAAASDRQPCAEARTPDGITHRLWSVTEPTAHAAVDDDLATRRALIADGHHRYATYRQLQADHRGSPGPWDRGLTLLVDTSAYGPQVDPIHRVVAMPMADVVRRTREFATVSDPIALGDLDLTLAAVDGFAVALSNRAQTVIVSGLSPELIQVALNTSAGSELGRLDVTILHKVLVERVWQLADTVETVGYAHDVPDALRSAAAIDGTAVLLRPTPIQAIAAIAAAGQRMPRKSTLFTPKPASGLVIRRLGDQ